MSGRPTKYKPEYCEQAQKLVMLGATDVQMADFFEVSISTFYLWKVQNPEFSDALKQSKEQKDAMVEKSLYERAVGYTCRETKVFNQNGEIITKDVDKHYPPDPTAQIFWLKNRQPEQWRDRRELTGADGEPLHPDNEKELAKRLVLILQEADNATTTH